MFEKSWNSVPPQLFTSGGTAYGTITVADTAGFKVKASLVISATSLPDLTVQCKRVLSKTQMIVGPIGKSINDTIDLSAYTVASGAFVYQNQQARVTIAPADITQAVYEQEPTVAIRVTEVDEYGNPYNDANPLPISFDGTVNVGDVSIVDSTTHDPMKVNVDGSINVNTNTPLLIPNIANIVVPSANTEMSYAFPPNTLKFLIKVRDGEAKMQLAFSPGSTGTTYMTLPRGSTYAEEANVGNKSIYFQLNNTNKVVEVLYWTQP